MRTGEAAFERLLEEAWGQLTSGRSGACERPAIELTAPLASAGLPSYFPVTETAVACVALALQAAAALAWQRGGRLPSVLLEPGHVGAAVRSERHFRVAGQSAGLGFASLSRFWRCGDGWVRTHANYPWHKAALLDALHVGEEPGAVGAAMAGLAALEVEDRVFRGGGVAAAVRSVDEWNSHPQGESVATEPLIGHRSIPGAPPRACESARLPAEGIKVLDLTRVIAGPVCTRYLGALGADVLRVDPPNKPDMAPGSLSDTLLAKRSAALDLGDRACADILHGLLDEADVVVCGYRPGSLERFGLSPHDLAARHPGLVVVYLSAWGHRGPWQERRGFDSVVQAATGIAAGEASTGDGAPGVLPCQLLDHGTGYLAAAAVLDGLSRQAAEGGTHIRTLSLARTARWLVTNRGGSYGEGDNDAGRWLVEIDGAAPVTVVSPPGAIDGERLQWPGAPAEYLSDQPDWSSAH